MKKIVVWTIFFAVAIAFWDLIIRVGIVSPAALATPLETFCALPGFFNSHTAFSDLSSTVSRSAIAFVLSVPIGLVAGVISFYSGPAEPPSRFSIDFLRSIPATALVPVFLIIFGIGDTAKIAAATFSSALVIALAVIHGLRGLNVTRIGVARILGFRKLRKIILCDLPEAAPQIFLGFRTGISLALILVIVAEMLIGSNHGLGKVIADMRYTDDKPRMYAAIIISGAIGFVYNVLVNLLNSTIQWRQYE